MVSEKKKPATAKTTKKVATPKERTFRPKRIVTVGEDGSVSVRQR